jgi:hypothetical protein
MTIVYFITLSVQAGNERFRQYIMVEDAVTAYQIENSDTMKFYGGCCGQDQCFRCIYDEVEVWWNSTKEMTKELYHEHYKFSTYNEFVTIDEVLEQVNQESVESN